MNDGDEDYDDHGDVSDVGDGASDAGGDYDADDENEELFVNPPRRVTKSNVWGRVWVEGVLDQASSKIPTITFPRSFCTLTRRSTIPFASKLSLFMKVAVAALT